MSQGLMRATSRTLLMSALLAVPAVAAAQLESTPEALKRAIEMYNNFNIEGARPILSRIVSPGYPLKVEPQEKVTAYKYLGASWAVLDMRDSAVTYFMAALDFDPFTDLNPQEFSAAEQNAFAVARQRLYKVALRPIVPQVLDSTYAFRLITTHRGSITATLTPLAADSTARKEILYSGDNDGIRDIPWRGLMRNGERADSITYELLVQGRSSLSAGTQTEYRELFRIEQIFEPLEDTLPDFQAGQLLQEQYRASAPLRDFAKGFALAAASVALPFAVLDSMHLTHAVAAGTLGIGTALGTFLYRRANRTIPANVAENNRRRAERNAFNAAVKRRNEQRLNSMKLLICPSVGCPR